MLILQSIGPAFGEASASAYCLKAMCLLEMSGLEWRPDFTVNVQDAPRGKLPVLVDGDVLVPDSSDIATYLTDTHGCDFMPRLTPVQKAQTHAISRTMEEHVILAITYDRWVLDDIWPHLKKAIFAGVPDHMRDQIADPIREGVKVSMVSQGIGRLSPEDVVNRVAKDFDALEVLLGDKPFLFGDTPTYADASAAPFLISILCAPVETLLHKHVKARGKLLSYVDRVRSAIIPNLPE